MQSNQHDVLFLALQDFSRCKVHGAFEQYEGDTA